jgi:hypothetical protein
MEEASTHFRDEDKSCEAKKKKRGGGAFYMYYDQSNYPKVIFTRKLVAIKEHFSNFWVFRGFHASLSCFLQRYAHAL